MRQCTLFNDNWFFSKQFTELPEALPENWEKVTLPHTWNALDGQDGGNDYWRGTACYVRACSRQELPDAEQLWLEFRGANSSADLYVNGVHLAHHDGGYSTWRVNITDALRDENLFAVTVDNSPNETVYPQNADFTFYGGLYRDVYLIGVSNTHFDLDHFGGQGIRVTPQISGDVQVESWPVGEYDRIVAALLDADGRTVAQGEGRDTLLHIDQVHLWNGRKDPYLYQAVVTVYHGEEAADQVSTHFGVRSYEIHPEKGFLLNGKEYPLRGVSRHQDRWQKGNALSPADHEEDMALICELGANTIRLAHYQHDQYFYDLCDRYGQVVWAEIPYISTHIPGGRDNTVQQMKELVIQNYHHPSIVVWGLSNEISMGGITPDIEENHRILNDLVHGLDPSRKTVVAALSMCPMDAEYLKIPDVVSYNHYFGWYGGSTDMNGPWFDKFHKKYPDIPIGCSEYGCEGLNWHNSDPRQGDYTEEYQAHYHEELIRQLYTRNYLWATHVWNMFDFGADARAEGGESGQNHKGLVTFDRSYKKDAFYAYKAWLSDEPFVHICGKRYVDRVEDVTKVTVYSNLPEVELFANGISLGKQSAEDHFFYFRVPNVGETVLKAAAGNVSDESFLRKVETFNESYRLKEQGAVLNWFDITEKEGYFSLNDQVGDILATFGGKLWMLSMLLSLKKQKGGEPQTSQKAAKDKGGFSMDLKNLSGMIQMMSGFTVLRLTSLAGMMNISFTKEDLLQINSKLNRIKKPVKK